MNENVYKKVELVGTSNLTLEAAVSNAIETSNLSLRNLRWFEVDEIRGKITNGQVDEWQVGLKVGFTIESSIAANQDEQRSQSDTQSFEGPAADPDTSFAPPKPPEKESA